MTAPEDERPPNVAKGAKTGSGQGEN